MSPSLERLVHALVPDHPPADVPVRATLRMVSNPAPIPITVLEGGAGAITFSAELRFVPEFRCVLSIAMGRFARLDFPVRVSAQGSCFQGRVVGTPLVLRMRSSRNARLEEVLGAAA